MKSEERAELERLRAEVDGVREENQRLALAAMRAGALAAERADEIERLKARVEKLRGRRRDAVEYFEGSAARAAAAAREACAVQCEEHGRDLDHEIEEWTKRGDLAVAAAWRQAKEECAVLAAAIRARTSPPTAKPEADFVEVLLDARRELAARGVTADDLDDAERRRP